MHFKITLSLVYFSVKNPPKKVITLLIYIRKGSPEVLGKDFWANSSKFFMNSDKIRETWRFGVNF